MKKQFIPLIITFFCILSNSSAKSHFFSHFNENALHIDFILAGDANEQQCYIDRLVEEPYWGGRQGNLDSTLNLGEYRCDVYLSQSKQLIYTEGFCTLFEEWRTTEEAKSLKRSFSNAIQIPFPKQAVEIHILYRNKGIFSDTLLSMSLDPNSQIIEKQSPPIADVKVLLKNGHAKDCVDIAILAEGYTAEEQSLFFEEAQKLADGLFSSAPFKKHKQQFNIYAIGIRSDESGVDNPHKDVWVNTPLNASFNTLYSDRYLMSTDVKSVRNYAALVPYDQIYILANTDKYGGGGIYNFYSLCSARGRSKSEVFIHEFGHAFAGLGDEYYSSDVSYNDFFDRDIELWQPNLSTLVDFDHKWKSLVDKSTPIPTPNTAKYRKKTGVFEGGGYSAKDIYRPAFDCRMKTNEADDFCEVCAQAIERTISFLTKH